MSVDEKGKCSTSIDCTLAPKPSATWSGHW